MDLRTYQTDAIAAVRRDWQTCTDVLGVAATGAGKTQVFLSLLMNELDAQPGARALILAHRKTLIDQPLERLRMIDPAWLGRHPHQRPRVGVVMAERDECDRQLTVATIQTLASDKRLQRLLAHGPVTHLVVDECHRATSPSYVKTLERLKAANPALRHLGVTATPLRSDGDGLARVYQTNSFKITIADLVKQHYLVQPRWLGIKTGISIKGVSTRDGDFATGELAERFDTPRGRAIIVQAYQEYAAGRRAIAFTASVQGAHDLAASFREAGIQAAAVDGTTPHEIRDQLFADFRAGRLTILCNCYVLVEGFDAPGTSCVLMCRPTKSDLMYVQAMGRGLRPAGHDAARPGMAIPGEDCLILDFLPEETRNIVMAGDVLGLPKETTRQALKEQVTEEGEVQAGFTFDGETFDSDGTPMEIIARQLNYLEVSLFRWHRRDGWMTLGLGKASDDNERILVVPPVGSDGIYTLYGMLKPPTYRADWRSKRIAASVSLEEIGAQAETIAERWSSGALVGKGRAWNAEPATDGQRTFLKRLARGALRTDEIDILTKGACASLITHFQAVQFLDIPVAQALEVSA
jgi:superfamily II DNA or RNA helicase